jgi:hypothetical protein
MAGIFDITQDFADFLHPADIQMARGMGQGGGSDFDYDTHNASLPHTEIWLIIPPFRPYRKYKCTPIGIFIKNPRWG